MNTMTLHPEVPVVNEHFEASPAPLELTLEMLSMVAGGFDGYNMY